MAKLYICGGVWAAVDDADYDWLNRYCWYFDGRYAFYMLRIGSKYRKKYMHSMINKTPKGFCTDHIDGNKLNNRRSNLRTATKSQNSQNRPVSPTSTSGYKGVCLCKKTGNWLARIKLYAKTIQLGSFPTKEAAAIAYNNAAIKHFKDFACLNEVRAIG